MGFSFNIHWRLAVDFVFSLLLCFVFWVFLFSSHASLVAFNEFALFRRFSDIGHDLRRRHKVAASLWQQLHRRPGLFAEAVKMAAVLVFPYCKRSDPCTTAPASFCSSSPAPPFFGGPRTCGGEPSPGYQPPMQSRTQLCVPGSAAFELQHHFSVFSSPSSSSLPVWPSSPPPV